MKTATASAPPIPPARTLPRTPQACSNCRRLKIRCNGIRPNCDGCRHRKIPCAWPSQHTQGTYVVASSPSSAILSAVHQAPPSISHLSATSTASPSSTTATPPALLRLSIDIFFARHHDAELCSFLHRPSLDIEVLSAQSPFLTASIISLSALYIPDNRVKSEFEFESGVALSAHYAAIARDYARALVDEPAIFSIQANLVLALRELITWTSFKAWMFAGIAIRQAQALRLGTEFNYRHSARQKETRRRTFWACFVMDRLIAHCCTRPQMIDIHSPYNGPGLEDILSFASHAPNLGVLPFLVATLRLWGDMSYLVVRDGRRLSKYSPTDPRSEFYQFDKAIDEVSQALPSCLKWSPQNYKLYRSVGQARPYINLHFLLHHAKCLMHSEYLPQSEKFIDLSDLDGEIAKDGAGLPLNYRDDRLISICVTNAVAISDIAEFLYHGDEQDREILQSTFAACAMMSAVGVHLWAQYTQPYDEPMGSSPRSKSNLLLEIMRSWQTQWYVSVAWVETLQMLYKLYEASYGDVGWADVLNYMEQDAVSGGGDSQSLAAEIVADNNRANPALSEGDGIPDPMVICRRLMDKVRLIMLLPLEATEVKKRNLNSFLRSLWQHMWDYEALSAFGDMVEHPTPEDSLVYPWTGEC